MDIDQSDIRPIFSKLVFCKQKYVFNKTFPFFFSLLFEVLIVPPTPEPYEEIDKKALV